MDIKKIQKSGLLGYLTCNRKVKIYYQPSDNCWEITDTSHGAIGHITLTNNEITEIVEAVKIFRIIEKSD